MKTKPNIILVDDHLLFRQILKSILTSENIAMVIGEASNGLELNNLLSKLMPDLVIMDIDMPNMDGIKATQKALEIMPDLKIIVFTMFGEEEYYHKMVGLGVKGFIIKSCSIDDIQKAIQKVMKGKIYFSPGFHITNSLNSPNPINSTAKWGSITKEHIEFEISE